MRGKHEKPSRNWLGPIMVFFGVAMVFGAIWVGMEIISQKFDVSVPSVSASEDPEDQEHPEESAVLQDMEQESVNLVAENEYNQNSFMQTGEFITYTGLEPTTVGIDVSDHQLDIDWETLGAEGIDFAIVRVGYRGYTEGTLNMDTRFEENIQGALDNGMDVGVYFFSQAISVEEAVEEAELVLEAIEGYDIRYPVVFDWEEILVEARTDNISPELLTECTIAFCEVIEEAGYTAGVYFNQTYGYNHFDLSQLSDYVLWLAQYSVAPDFYYHFDMWQYTASGNLAGIETPVDLNMSFWQPEGN